MSYLISNIPHFKCWVRREFTCNHQQYHGEFLHALAFAVNTIPDRSLSFQVVFTGCTEDENVHGGAMWARMPIQALVADIPVDEWAEPMEDHLAQPLRIWYQNDLVPHSLGQGTASQAHNSVVPRSDYEPQQCF